jgi:hypothetical protein
LSEFPLPSAGHPIITVFTVPGLAHALTATRFRGRSNSRSGAPWFDPRTPKRKPRRDARDAGKELAGVGSTSDREKLAGYADRYRMRQGNYRVIHPIDEEASVVTIYRIGH